MGSVVLTQAAHDATHYHKSSMLETSHNHRNQSRSSPTRNRSHSRPLPPTSTQSRPPTSTSSPDAHTQSSQARSPLISQTSQPPQDAPSPPPEPALEPSSQASTAKLGDSIPDLISDGSSAATSPATSFEEIPAIQSPKKIQIKSLQHIQSFLDDETSPLGSSRPDSRQSNTKTQSPQYEYEISAMPIADVIEMVAGLLTKITTTNDKQHQHLHQPIGTEDGSTNSNVPQQTSSVLAFHGKNVPSITILSYLSRIHRYCPTTYEVFISLLVYFDRMTEKVNSGPMQSLQRQANVATPDQHDSPILPPTTDAKDYAQHNQAEHGKQEDETTSLAHFFVVDSFNIHRLVIAAVTCASKYFSDVFYTNSRYAKV